MTGYDRRHLITFAGGALALIGLAGSAAQGMTSAKRQTKPGIVKYAEVNGTRLAYQIHSNGVRRRPLVLVHGYALRATGDIYAALIAQLVVKFDVYALDLRGHGGSASSFTGWSQTAIADDVAAFVAKLGLRGALFAGHSLGGFTGMLAQIRHPGTFSALALLATAVAAGGSVADGTKEAFMNNAKDKTFTEPAFAAMYLRPNKDNIGKSVDAISLIDPSVHDAFFTNYARNVITEELSNISVPVLLINGRRDTVVAPEQQHATALGLANSKEVIFSNEGHMMPIEAPDATAREMINFFLHDIAK